MIARLAGWLSMIALVVGGAGMVQDVKAAGAEKGSLQSVIGGAKKEGTLNFYASSAMGPKGAIAIQDALNKKYGVALEFHYTPSGSMTRDVAKVATALAAGGPPDWDIMIVNDAHYNTLTKNDAVDRVDWVGSFGLEPKSLYYGGLAVTVASQFVAPAYNKQTLKPSDAPKNWDGLLDPKLKGKIGVASSTHHWARLAQLWGDEKTTQFVKALAEQKIMKGRVPEIYTRLQLGEVQVAATMVDDYIIVARRTGAPVVFVENIDPVIVTQWLGAPLQKAKHRNAAILLTVFLSSDEGQAVWEKIMGQTSMYIKGTSAYKRAQKGTVIALDAKFARTELGKLSRKYGKMLGYR